MPTRYKVTFRSMDYLVETKEYRKFNYVVCTCLDASKAIVMAAIIHTEKQPESHIYAVEQVVKLDGTEALGTDLTDRMEY